MHKVTIIPRGMALGLTQQLPLEDRYTYPRCYLEAGLKVLMGGRLAEELIFGVDRITTGAGNDIERATELARKMVCEWGMSPTMGPLTFGKREEAIFLGKEFCPPPGLLRGDRGPDRRGDPAVRPRARATAARTVLEDHRAALDGIASALLEHEVLDGEDIYRLIQTHSGIDARVLKSQHDHRAVTA